MISAIQRRGEELSADEQFVGGIPQVFAEVGRDTLITALANGLTPEDLVLEIGCCVLRGGYWLMNFVQPGKYCGIEPNKEWVSKGLSKMFLPGEVDRLRPRFTYNDEFDFSEFGETFNFFIGRSIWTHCSRSQIQQCLKAFIQYGNHDSKMLMSICWPEDREEHLHDSWDPEVKSHDPEWLSESCHHLGVEWRPAIDPLPVRFNQHWVLISRAS